MDNTTRKSADNIAEDICEAIEIVVQQALGKLQYDQTVIATIIDDSKRDNGIYQVQSKDVKFEVYADTDANYKIQDQVRVSILNGDYSEKKFIVGKYIAETGGQSISHIVPRDTMIELDNNSLMSGIVSNIDPKRWPNESEILIYNKEIAKGTYYDKSLYDSLYVSLKITTNLLANIKYGIKIVINEETDEKRILYFNSKEFIGNPNKFIIPSEQQKIFDIINYGDITNIKIYAYRDNNDELPKDSWLIEINDIKIGGDLSVQEDHSVTIYTNDSEVYSRTDEGQALDRTVQLRWINKTDKNEYIGFNNGIIQADYNEFNYLDKVAYNAKLLSYKDNEMPKSEKGLGVWDNYQQVIPTLNDLDDVLKQLDNCIFQASYDRSLENVLKLKAISEQLGILRDEIKSYSHGTAANGYNLFHTMKSAMEFATAKENGEETSIVLDESNDPWLSFYKPKLNSVFSTEGGIVPINEWANLTLEGSNITLFANLFTQIEPLKDKIVDTIFTTIKNYLANNWTDIQNIAAGEPEYQPINTEEYANHYNIYWYIKDAAAPADELMPEGWRRLTEKDNACMPVERDINSTIEIDGKTIEYYVKSNAGQTVALTVEPQAQETTYKAVLVYNHEKFLSNELKFINLNNFEIMVEDDIANAFSLTHGNNSRSTYQLYDFTNYIMSNYEAMKPRQIKPVYSGLLGGNESLQNSTFYWYIPVENTMLNFELNGTQVACDKPGYACYQFNIGDKDDYTIEYKIKDYYTSTATNNTVYCKLQKEEIDYEYEAEIAFVFASFGNNGTDYSLIITTDSENRAVTEEKPLVLRATLYDYDGNKIAFGNGENDLEIKYSVPFDKTVMSKEGEIIIEIPYSNNITSYGHLTMECNAVKVNSNDSSYCVSLTAEYAIPYASDINYCLVGPTQIVYNSFGTEPKYNSDTLYAIYDKSTDATFDPTGVSVGDNYNCYLDANNNRKLAAGTMYISGGIDYPALQVYGENGVLLWEQEIIITQNRYGIPAVNTWDGSFGFSDEENKDSLFTAMLGVGKKDTQNRFTGMIMGEVGKTQTEAKWGLYGYDSGVASFGFMTDGSAFIGKNTTTGKIDFSNGTLTINAKNFSLNAASGGSTGINKGLYLTSAPNLADGNYYFFIGDKSKNGYLALDGDYNFTLAVNQLILTAGKKGDDDYFYLSNYKAEDGNKLIIGKNFAVTTNGSIKANDGTIGGITLSENGLSSASEIEATPINTFKATMNYNKSTKQVKVSDYGSTIAGIWINNVYEFPDSTSIIYLNGWGTSTEFYVMTEVPEEDGTYSVTQHQHANYITDSYYEIKAPAGVQKWYLVINKKPTTIAEPVFTTQKSAFKIGDNGEIMATNAILGGTIKASSITANKASEICGWEFKSDELAGEGDINLSSGSIIVRGGTISITPSGGPAIVIGSDGYRPYISYRSPDTAFVEQKVYLDQIQTI